MRKLYLIRHGQTIFNEKGLMQGWSDSPLTKLGIKQTMAAKEFIEEQNIQFDKVFSSPLTRCLTTTKLLTDLDYETHPGLVEWNFGYYEGEPSHVVFKEVRWTDMIFGHHQNYFHDNHGESYTAFIERFSEALKEIVSQGHQSTLVVSHGAVLRLFFNLFNDESDLNGEYFMNNCILEYNVHENNEVEFVAIYNPAKRVR